MSSAASYGCVYFDRRCFRKDDVKSSKVRKLYVCNSVSSTPQGLQFANTKVQIPEKTVRIGVLGASGYTGSEEWLHCTKIHSCILSFKPNGVSQNTNCKSLCAMNMTAGQSGNPEKINLDRIINKARKIWDSSPQSVKTFPWNRALENFIQLILDLIVAVIKYLCLPVLAVSSLSEMSYCAHEKKLFLVPIPLLVGVAVAGVLRETALELSPLLKDAEVPWHLIAIAIFFTLLKLPGPYYPYWGRIFIPHFANGGLLRTLYFAFLWYRRPQKASEPLPPESS